MAVADQIRNYRLSYKMTQEQLAKKLKTTKITVLRWENGHYLPAGEQLRLLRSLGFDDGEFNNAYMEELANGAHRGKRICATQAV